MDEKPTSRGDLVRTPGAWAVSHMCSTAAIIGFVAWISISLAVFLPTAPIIGVALAAVPAFPTLYYYMYLRLFRQPIHDAVRLEGADDALLKSRRRASLICYWVWWLFYMVALPVSDSLSGDEPNLFVVIGYNLFGSTLVLLVSLFVMEVLNALRFAVGWYQTRKAAANVSPRGAQTAALSEASTILGLTDATWMRVRTAIVLVLYVSITVASLGSGYGEVRVSEAEVPLAKLPACLDGYKVAVVTDVHAGPLVGRGRVQQLVQQVNGLNADAVLLVGDFADGQPVTVGGALEPMRDLSAADGVYFVTGNHEYSHGATGRDWMDWWANSGATVLDNSMVAHPPASSKWRSSAECADASFDMVGVTDYSDGDKDLPAATAGRDVSREALLLAHQPLQAYEAAELNVGLQVSGHTHAGQTFPLHMTTYFGNRGLFTGYYQLDRSSGSRLDIETATPGSADSMTLYVSEGAFGWGPRVRLGTTNEVGVITLRNADAFVAEGKTLESGFGDEAGQDRASTGVMWMSVMVLPLMVMSAVAVSLSEWAHRTAYLCGWLDTPPQFFDASHSKQARHPVASATSVPVGSSNSSVSTATGAQEDEARDLEAGTATPTWHTNSEWAHGTVGVSSNQEA